MKKLNLKLNNYLKNDTELSALLNFYNIQHKYILNTSTLTFLVPDSFKEEIIKYPEVSLSSFYEYIIDDDEHSLLEGMYHIIFDHREVINDDIFSLINSILLTMDLNLVCLELGDDQFYLTIAPIQAVKNLGMEFLNSVRYGDQKYGFEFKRSDNTKDKNINVKESNNLHTNDSLTDSHDANMLFNMDIDISNTKSKEKKDKEDILFIKDFKKLLEQHNFGESFKEGDVGFKNFMLEYRESVGLDSQLFFDYKKGYLLYKAIVSVGNAQQMDVQEVCEALTHIAAAESEYGFS
jgi:hypothetical protein